MILKGLPYFKSNGDHNLKIMFSVSVWPEMNELMNFAINIYTVLGVSGLAL